MGKILDNNRRPTFIREYVARVSKYIHSIILLNSVEITFHANLFAKNHKTSPKRDHFVIFKAAKHAF